LGDGGGTPGTFCFCILPITYSRSHATFERKSSNPADKKKPLSLSLLLAVTNNLKTSQAGNRRIKKVSTKAGSNHLGFVALK
jgi:hypothetical protein